MPPEVTGPPAITAFGAFHTAVSVLAIVFGAWALVRDGKIDPANRIGQWYVGTMLIGCLTAFGIYHRGGFGPGHVLSIVTLVFLLAGMFASRIGRLGGAAAYVQTISFSVSFFLLMFFATTETLTRLPVDHPFAPSQEAAELIPVRILLLVGLLAGLAYQVFHMRAARART
ncbi:MAG: hypothetical protein WD845_12820 [Pirellulales bacterium]